MYMDKGSFGDTMKGVFYLILILIILFLIAKYWGFRQFFNDIIRFVGAIFSGIGK
jgi:hypothetical protein